MTDSQSPPITGLSYGSPVIGSRRSDPMSRARGRSLKDGCECEVEGSMCG